MQNLFPTELENLSGTLATSVANQSNIETAEQALAVARALAIIEFGVADTLRMQLETWTLQNGPITIDTSGDQAYGHWEKKTTTVGDENALWAFLSANGKDVNHYKRADLTVIKGLLQGDEVLEGIEQHVGTDISYVFGFKRNLLTRPRAHSQAKSGGIASGPSSYRLGPQGVINRAQVIRYTPTDRVVEPSCSVMPPERVSA